MTMFNNQQLQAYLRQVNDAGKVPLFRCADGFSVSIYAGACARCEPDDDAGPWSSVELYQPSAPMPALAIYHDRDECYWRCVPARSVIALINAHGGADETRLSTNKDQSNAV
jgi:hypothetical protein